MSINDTFSYLHWVDLAHLVAQLGFCSTTVFCYVMIFLTLFGVKRNFGTYKYLLVIFPTVGIFFATFEFVIYPNVHSFNASYIFYTNTRPFNLSRDIVTWFLAFYTGIYASTISLIAVQFVYRYWAIFDERKLRYFKGGKFLLCIVYVVFFGVQWGLGCYYFAKIDEYSENYLKTEMLLRYDIDMADVSGMALVAYDSKGNYRWWNLFCTGNMTIIMLIQYTIIIYCAVTMYQKMEAKLEAVSVSVRNTHKQFFKTLVLQITTPTICLFSPVILIIYLPLLDLKVNIPTGIFLCAFTLYPAMDAMIIMYIVTDYRKAAKSTYT